MKKLGFGLMRLPTLDKNDPSKVDLEQLKQMVDLFLEKGFTYFDTAWMYNAFASEGAAKAALVDRYPRESFTLATKLHSGFFNSLEDRDKIFNAQLEKTGAGYFDYYLLHGIEGNVYDKFEQFDCFNWLLEKKAQGLVKHAGFSYHDDPELLDKILTKHPEMEFVQLQINYLDWDSPWIHSKGVYEVARKHNVPIIVMEPVKGGTLAHVPESVEQLFREKEPNLSVASWAVRFAASLPGVMMVLSGMSDLQQMEDNLSYMEDFKPLDEAERATVQQVVDILNSLPTIPCTACKYCVDGCPQKINIPGIFKTMNDLTLYNNVEGAKRSYENVTKEGGKAGDCVQCGACEAHCPQKIQIIETLKKAAQTFA